MAEMVGMVRINSGEGGPTVDTLHTSTAPTVCSIPHNACSNNQRQYKLRTNITISGVCLIPAHETSELRKCYYHGRIFRFSIVPFSVQLTLGNIIIMVDCNKMFDNIEIINCILLGLAIVRNNDMLSSW